MSFLYRTCQPKNEHDLRPFKVTTLNAHYAVLLLFAALYGPGSALMVYDVLKVWPALTISTILAICGILRLSFRTPAVFAIVNIVTALALGGTIPAFFLATGPVVVASNSTIFDPVLLEADDTILGGFYPEGQLSLYLDQSKTLNPSTGFGRFYTEVLQLFYVSYYLWGAIPFFYILYKYTYSHNWRCSDRGKDQNSPNKFETALSARYLAEMKLYLCGWMSAYFITFLINRAFPAKSPRLYLKSQFEHPLEGWGLASSLIGVATDDTSYGSFPSGHFNQTLVCAMFAYRIFRPLGIVIFVAAGGIALATQVLRYHYFIDIVAGLVVAAMAISFGFNWSRDSYQSKLEAALVEYEERQGLAMTVSSKKDELECDHVDCCAVQLDEISPASADGGEILLDVSLETLPNPSDSTNIVLRSV